MSDKKTYLIKSKLNYGLIYGAWIEGDSWCFESKRGGTCYLPLELYEISCEWPPKPNHPKWWKKPN